MNQSRQYLKLNKNILAAIAASIIVSAGVAHVLEQQEAHLNTTYTLIVDYVVYFAVFAVLFYVDNRSRYKLDSELRGDLIKLITSLGIGEIIYSISRWFLQYYLLTLHYDAYLASIIGQGISTVLYLIIINFSVRITKLFDTKH